MGMRTVKAVQKKTDETPSLPKAPTGIQGLDEITRGGFRRGRPTLVWGGQDFWRLGFDLDELVKEKKLAIDFVRIERSEIDETGDYDLEGLFIRLGAAIDAVGAGRVVLDTIENLFSGLQNQGILRAELRRLFRWLKDRRVTAVITAERGEA